MPTQPARRTPAPRRFAARLLAGLAIAAIAAPAAPLLRHAIERPVDTKSAEVAVTIDRGGDRLVRLPIAASHVSVHWTGSPDAHLTLNLGKSQGDMSEDIAIGADDDAAPWADPTTTNFSE